MLGRPAPGRSRSVVVRPHDLVQEAVAPEDLIEQHLAVVRFPRVDMEVQRPVGREDAPRFHQPRAQPAQVVVERVVEAVAGSLVDPVEAAGEAGAPRRRIGGGSRAHAAAPLPGVEGRIRVHQAGAAAGQPSQHLERLAGDDRGRGGAVRLRTRFHPRLVE